MCDVGGCCPTAHTLRILYVIINNRSLGRILNFSCNYIERFILSCYIIRLIGNFEMTTTQTYVFTPAQISAII